MFHKQQHHYGLHISRPDSAFTSRQATALLTSVNESLANLLRLEGKHRQTLVHIAYCIAGQTRPPKSLMRKLPAYVNRAKFILASLRDIERLIQEQRSDPDLADIQRQIQTWE